MIIIYTLEHRMLIHLVVYSRISLESILNGRNFSYNGWLFLPLLLRSKLGFLKSNKSSLPPFHSNFFWWEEKHDIATTTTLIAKVLCAIKSTKSAENSRNLLKYSSPDFTDAKKNQKNPATFFSVKLISWKISWNWFHGKSALLWNQTSLLCSVQRLTQPQAQHHISRLENPHNFLQNPTFTSSAQISSLSSHWGEVIATCCKCDGKIMSCFCI